MIPGFDKNGNLPPGVHETDWDEITERFGNTFLEFFQIDRETEAQKGIVALEL